MKYQTGRYFYQYTVIFCHTDDVCTGAELRFIKFFFFFFLKFVWSVSTAFITLKWSMLSTVRVQFNDSNAECVFCVWDRVRVWRPSTIFKTINRFH